MIFSADRNAVHTSKLCPLMRLMAFLFFFFFLKRAAQRERRAERRKPLRTVERAVDTHTHRHTQDAVVAVCSYMRGLIHSALPTGPQHKCVLKAAGNKRVSVWNMGQSSRRKLHHTMHKPLFTPNPPWQHQRASSLSKSTVQLQTAAGTGIIKLCSTEPSTTHSNRSHFEWHVYSVIS